MLALLSTPRELTCGFYISVSASEHPKVATGLNNLAELYRAQGRYAEADRLDARAKMIGAKRAKENPEK